ncbi:type IV pilus modification PilV family protein [Bacillus benzoevorans]|uniref:Type II secretory pathway pseudopilin PulG n=1 Tax=Bacillus benzoevorans TaxID=1456 RepID=A0A7X0LWZ0_9BACI|nr:type II secretion system protein [Bacillus benzoevorans]MBB6445859.1 type II secretory pathway pseudopilin PulG [Bacillus benzoevorans]
MRNEKGSTLIQVLLVILIFSVLGLSLMINVVGENKRVNITDSNVQTRNLARDGLIYFETSFKDYIDNNKPITLNELKGLFSDAKYPEQGWMTIRDEKNEKIQIKVSHPDIIKSNPDGIEYSDETAKRNYITVYSKGDDGTTVTELTGHYKLDFEFDVNTPTVLFAQFEEGTKAVDFAGGELLGLEIIAGLVGVDALDFIFWHGDDGYYPVPDDGILDIDLLGDALEVNLLGLTFDLLLNLINSISGGTLDLEIPRFHTMENNPVVAVRDAKAVGLDLLKIGEFNLLSLDILKLPVEKNVNVLINGHYGNVKVPLVSSALDKILGFLLPNLIPLEGGHQDIDFEKLSVVGNVIIQQDKNDCKDQFLKSCEQNMRRFTFENGLFVTQTLLVGGERVKYNIPELDKAFGKNENHLELGGDMVAMRDFMIDSAKVKFIDDGKNTGSNIYVHHNAVIRKSCIQSDSSMFRLFVKDKLTIENNVECASYNGLFYAENGIEVVIPEGQTMIINGEVIGDIKISGGGTLIIHSNSYNSVEFKDIKLISQGRVFEGSE